MFKQLDELIDLNLKRMAETESSNLWVHEFIDLDNNEIYHGLRFAEIMENKGLVKIEPSKRERIDLIEFGYNIYKQGGWLKYLKIQQDNELKQKQKNERKESLELKLKEMQTESLEYQKTIRKLEKELKISSLLKNWWWLLASAIGLGITIGGFLF